MDLWTQIQFLTIPKGLRNFIVGLTVALFGICVYMFAVALYGSEKPDWIEAAAYLTSIVFPITLAIILISSLQSGMQSIQLRVNGFLTQALPELLRLIPEQDVKFQPFHDQGSKFESDAPNRMADIEIGHVEDTCIAFYKICFDKEDGRRICMRLRLDVNVRRVNLVIFFDAEKLENMAGVKEAKTPEDDEKILDVIFTKLKHTLFSAEMNVVTKKKTGGSDHDPDDMTYDEGYQFNRNLMRQSFDGKRYYGVVGVRKVSDDMLWHAAEKIYFSQDLLIMLRATVYEAPELFEESA